MAHHSNSSSTSRRLCSLAEAASLLGVHERTIRRYIAAGRLTGYRVGPSLVRLNVAEVENLAQPIPTAKA